MAITRKDQRRIVNEMCAGLRKTLLETLPRVPAEWDGIELRQWFADTARERYAFNDKLTGKRRRDYVNTSIVNNL